MPEVGMPRLSDTMREGAISRWLVDDQSVVSRGQEILEIETDKATMAYEAEHDGVLRILLPEGVSVEIGHLIATIGDVAAATTPPRRADVSPLSRRLAAENDIDLFTLRGSGPEGKVTRDDVLAAVVAKTLVSPAGTASPHATVSERAVLRRTEPERTLPDGAELKERRDSRVRLTRSQQLIASRMSETKQTVPDFTATVSVDVTRLASLREELRAGGEITPTLNDFVVKAVALALVEHPRLNGYFDDGDAVLYGSVNIGVAVAIDDGLVVPTIADADRKSLTEIAVEARDLARQARAGKISLASLAGGTFTISNLGGLGVTSFSPIINGAQAAILGVGAAVPTCVPTRVATRATAGTSPGFSIDMRSLMNITLTCDHRIVYGAEAAKFLNTVKEQLQEPLPLLLNTGQR